MATATSRLFDAYLVVDWSARNSPGRRAPGPHAVWVGESIVGGPATETYQPTRSLCRRFLLDRLSELLAEGRRVFVGFDFPYGYPEGFARSIGLVGGPAWRAGWEELSRLIVDEDDNQSNRFDVAAALNARCGGSVPGPFWGLPRGALSRPSLLPTSPIFPYIVANGRTLPRLRRTERAVAGTQEVWKLVGVGSVGSQALVGIPFVAGLRFSEFAGVPQAVWPFETGFTARPTPAAGPFVLHAEIWPGAVPPIYYDSAVTIRDQAQVRATAAWLSHLDGPGSLGRLFDDPGLSGDDLAVVVGEEGWIVGGLAA